MMNNANEFHIRFPELEAIEQGKEFFFLEHDDRQEKIGFHDYDRIYEIPGLYEYLFYEKYHCNSPQVVCNLLKRHIDTESNADEPLTALDVGAGNGMVGEKLAEIGAETIVGIDIIEEAAKATQRDRPGIYQDYHVADLTALSSQTRKSLNGIDFNCMTVIAALGFGDIPPQAFAEGYNLLEESAWVAFNIKEDFICNHDQSGFCQLIHQLDNEEILDIHEKHRYRHRFCQDGTPLYYYAVVGKKQKNIPVEKLTDIYQTDCTNS